MNKKISSASHSITNEVLYPILKYVNYKMRKNLKKGDKELFKENIRAMQHINSFDMLSSRSCVIVARKNY